MRRSAFPSEVHALQSGRNPTWVSTGIRDVAQHEVASGVLDAGTSRGSRGRCLTFSEAAWYAERAVSGWYWRYTGPVGMARSVGDRDVVHVGGSLAEFMPGGGGEGQVALSNYTTRLRGDDVNFW